MKFSLATLATVALATQSVTADWLSGKAGKYFIKAQPVLMRRRSNTGSITIELCPQTPPIKTKLILTDE